MSVTYPDFQSYGFFSKARYDGKFLWIDSNPKSENDLFSLEFKVKLDDLINEFNSAIHDKEFKDLSLIVVWDRRTTKPLWNVRGISDARRTNLETTGVPTNIIEYVLEDNHGNYCPLVCVADLMENIEMDKDDEDDLDEFIIKMG